MTLKYLIMAASAILAVLNCSCSPKNDDLWFKLSSNERIVFRADLEAGTQREFDITSSEPLLLLLQTDASFELMGKYRDRRPLPVRLEHRKAREALGTIRGVGAVWFAPIDGIIPLKLTNETDVRLRIAVYKRI